MGYRARGVRGSPVFQDEFRTAGCLSLADKKKNCAVNGARPDVIIKNALVYMTFRRCFEKRDVAVSGALISEVAPEIHSDDPAVRLVDGWGKYLIPGLVDIHMHIESSMTYPEEFSRLALMHGTTTVVADAHEIANVFGLEGTETFSAQKTELDIFYAIPSSVPSTDNTMETSGGEIGEAEAERMLADDRVLCLGEVMNYQSLVAPPEEAGSDGTKIQRLIALCREKRGRDIRIEGHCPKISGRDLNRFIYAGVDADHTQQTAESVLEKTDLGMFLELQLKSLTPPVAEAVRNHGIYDNVALITDDTMPDQLMTGQLNRVVRAAVQAGIPAEQAVYCATWTPARRMHLDDRGMIGPGKLADMVLLNDLESFRPVMVFKGGKQVEPSDWKKPEFPQHFYQSVKCRKAVADDFVLRIDRADGMDCAAGTGDAAGAGHAAAAGRAVGTEVTANVMQISTFGTATKHVRRRLPVRNGVVCWQEAGLCLAVLFERHGKNGNIAYGLVEGALQKKGAVASSWSHDSHNLLVLGNSPEDMVLAQNRVVELQGAYVAACGGMIAAEARLDVGGILSSGPVEELAESLGRVRAVMQELGYRNNNEIMSAATLTLPVSPELKLTDYGLLDVKSQKPVKLLET